MPELLKIQLRHDTAANWTTANPVLSLGTPGYETDTGKIKYGDGTTAWTSLAYYGTSLFAPETGSTIYATLGANSDITSLSGLTTALSIAQGGTGATTALAALTALGGAPIANPVFTGTPEAPTATAGTNTNQLATTAFVTSAVSAAGGVTSITGTDGVTPTVLSTGAITLGLSAVPNTVLAGNLISSITSGSGLTVTNPTGVGAASVTGIDGGTA